MYRLALPLHLQNRRKLVCFSRIRIGPTDEQRNGSGCAANMPPTGISRAPGRRCNPFTMAFHLQTLWNLNHQSALRQHHVTRRLNFLKQHAPTHACRWRVHRPALRRPRPGPAAACNGHQRQYNWFEHPVKKRSAWACNCSGLVSPLLP